MTELRTKQAHWTVADLDLLPDNGTRYEIVDGELFMSKSPHFEHQYVTTAISGELNTWSRVSGLGRAAVNPGIIFSDADHVIPDVVWISTERLAALMNASGHLTSAPELVVEVLSPGTENERRDRDIKLRLYSVRGVREYWVADWQNRQVEVYRRENAALRLVMTLFAEDEITSPLLPGFTCPVLRFFQ